MEPRIHTEDLRLRSGRPGPARRGDHTAPMIAATLYLPADAAPPRPPTIPSLPGLVVGHGAGSRRERHRSFCRAACATGMVVIAIDFRGHGDSTGAVDGPLHEDVIAAARLLRSHPLVDRMRIGYRGSSMGGYYGVLAAADAELAALALLCPAREDVLLTGLDRAIAEGAIREGSAGGDSDYSTRVDEHALRDFLQTHPMLPAARDVACPALLLHARGDDVVRLDDTLELAACLSGPVEVIVTRGGDHRSLQASADVHHRVAQWLAAALGAPAANGPVSARTGRT